MTNTSSDSEPAQLLQRLVFTSVERITGVRLEKRNMTPAMLRVLSQFAERHQELENSVAELKRQLTHDVATGLPNHLAFEEYMHTLIEERKQRPLAERATDTVAFLDVNYFKSFNTQFQMPQTDEIMKSLAAEIMHAISMQEEQHGENRRNKERVHKDIFSRSKRGGDEFVACMPGMSEDMAKQRFDNVLEQIRQKVFLVKTVDEKCFKVTNISLAVGVYQLDSELERQRYNRFHDVMSKVETRMHDLKASHKDNGKISEPVFKEISREEYDALSMDKNVIKVKTPGSPKQRTK